MCVTVKIVREGHYGKVVEDDKFYNFAEDTFYSFLTSYAHEVDLKKII